MDDLPSLTAQLNALVKEICQENVAAANLDSLTEKLLAVLGNMAPLDLSSAQHKAVQPQIEQSAVSLWNLAVARMTGGTLTPMANARLRHIACNLIFICHSSGQEADDNIWKKQTMMALKTARAWLDANNPSMADNPLSMASECIEKLRGHVIEMANGEEGDAAATERRKLEVTRDHFKVVCYKAEAAAGQGEQQTALGLIEQAKSMLHQLPQESCYLSMLCYNFGVQCFQQSQYEVCTSWLKESFELGKSSDAVGCKVQARTLRLLANAYLEWNSEEHWQKALNAIGLANAEHSHPAGLYQKARIILLQGDPEDPRLKTALDHILRHPDISAELGLNAVRLYLDHKHQSLAFDGLKQLTNKFQNCPEHSRVSISHLEMLLQCKKLPEAKQLVEDVITGHNTGKPVDPGVRKRFHVLLWEQAGENFETGNYKEALQWYNYSWSLFSPGEHSQADIGKLHRNRASCCIGLDELDKAEEAVAEAMKSDPTSPHTHYVKFKIALAKNQDQEAIEAIQKLSDAGTGATGSPDTDINASVQGLVCLAAQLAFDHSNRMVAVKALESLVNHSTNHQQVLTALRCLTRLKFTALDDTQKASDFVTIATYVKSAYKRLVDVSDGQCCTPNLQDEGTWFMKIAWNMALQCGEASHEMHEFFVLCHKLTCLLPSDMAALVRQKTCLLMAAAASLQVAKTATQEPERRVALQEAIQHIQECYMVCDNIQKERLVESDPRSQDSTTAILLVLYEFEARAKLGDPEMEKVLEKALALPQSEPKAFETIAALAMEPPADNRSVSIRALKVAIKKHLQSSTVDYPKCSKVFHSLIELALQAGSRTDPTSKEEAWGYYMDVLEVIQNRAKELYPAEEILWLMTKSWNCGVHLYSSCRYPDALRWCELAMKLQNHLGPLKVNYETHMATVYGDILAKMDDKDKDGV